MNARNNAKDDTNKEANDRIVALAERTLPALTEATNALAENTKALERVLRRLEQ